MSNSTFFVSELLGITVSNDSVAQLTGVVISSVTTYLILQIKFLKRFFIETVRSKRKTNEFVKSIKNLDDIIQEIRNLFRRK